MAKEKLEETKEEKIGEPIVVSEVPKVEARVFTDDKEVNHPILTTEEALTEILQIVRKLEKVWGK